LTYRHVLKGAEDRAVEVSGTLLTGGRSPATDKGTLRRQDIAHSRRTDYELTHVGIPELGYKLGYKFGVLVFGNKSGFAVIDGNYG